MKAREDLKNLRALRVLRGEIIMDYSTTEDTKSMEMGFQNFPKNHKDQGGYEG